ncbi:MAG TPA: hypothetical protein VIZ19_11515 [Roseiarcus sp.]
MFLSVLSVCFSIFTYLGAWNYLRGDNALAVVAARFDKSYSEDASRPVRRGDKEWPQLIDIISKYTLINLPHNREPVVLARFVAITSAKTEIGGELKAEWTAPSTPIVLLYKDWPGHGTVGKEDFRIVGTIQDLHDWIRRDEADFDFFWRNIILGLLSACIGVFLALRA